MTLLTNTRLSETQLIPGLLLRLADLLRHPATHVPRSLHDHEVLLQAHQRLSEVSTCHQRHEFSISRRHGRRALSGRHLHHLSRRHASVAATCIGRSTAEPVGRTTAPQETSVRSHLACQLSAKLAGAPTGVSYVPRASCCPSGPKRPECHPRPGPSRCWRQPRTPKRAARQSRGSEWQSSRRSSSKRGWTTSTHLGLWKLPINPGSWQRRRHTTGSARPAATTAAAADAEQLDDGFKKHTRIHATARWPAVPIRRKHSARSGQSGEEAQSRDRVSSDPAAPPGRRTSIADGHGSLPVTARCRFSSNKRDRTSGRGGRRCCCIVRSTVGAVIID